MSSDRISVVHSGDEYGNDMVVKITCTSGREILALATRNLYSGDWDFGPTWNYVIKSDKSFLVDTGRRGRGLQLMQMMEHSGIKVNDLDFVILSHGHEDHDGGLFALNQTAGLEIMAHETYDALREFSPERAPSTRVESFPASCWHCPLSYSFAEKNCSEYHKERRSLKVTSISQESHDLGQGVSLFHVPGHSPDCIALLLDNEVILTGDTILPEITPLPSRAHYFESTQCMLPPHYADTNRLYGLSVYIRSVKRLLGIASRFPNLTVLPGHRFFTDSKCNLLDLGARCNELIQHHIQRCSDFVDLVHSEPKTPEEIAHEYFEPELLAGFGINLALNEVLSHCELMELSGDIIWTDGKVISTGTRNSEAFIRNIE